MLHGIESLIWRTGYASSRRPDLNIDLARPARKSYQGRRGSHVIDFNSQFKLDNTHEANLSLLHIRIIFNFVFFVIFFVVPEQHLSAEPQHNTKISVTYDLIRVLKDNNNSIETIPHYRTYILSKNNNISIQRGNDVSDTHTFRGEFSGKAARQWLGTVRIVDGIIFIVTDYGGYTTYKKISTDGKTTCKCEIIYMKKQGHKYFEVNIHNSTTVYSEMHAENITCAISQLDN
jgi:hypothetical protein